MKKVFETIRNLMICMIAAVCMTALFIGAALQESYKLNPLTAEEVMEVSK